MSGEPSCNECGKLASEIEALVLEAKENDMSPSDYAMEDGTYHPKYNKFICTECYVRIGCPLVRTI